MPKYMVTASYTQAGTQGLLKDGGSKRREVADNLIKGMGGSMEAFYYAFGSDDLIVIADMPDDASMVATALAVGAGGGVTLNTTLLLDPETIDEAAKKTADYAPPGA